MVRTGDNREKQSMTTVEKFPVKMILQSKPSYNVIKKRNGCHRIHPPLQCR